MAESMSLRLLLLVSLICLCMAPRSYADPPRPLAVVTYNIRYANPNDGQDIWPHRVEAVADFIARYDLIGLQEVTFDQLVELRERLQGFGYYGVGRDDGKNGGEHAVIFYRNDLLEPVDQGTFWLSENPARVGVEGWDAALPRTCTWMVLRRKSDGRQLWVANTHFDHRGAKARAESAKLIRRVAGESSGPLPVIVMGDFNCVADSDPYRALTTDRRESNAEVGAPLADARSISKTPPKGPASTWNGFREIVADRIIDHIFVRGGLEVTGLETLDPKTAAGRFASDHLPVVASIRLLDAIDATPKRSP